MSKQVVGYLEQALPSPANSPYANGSPASEPGFTGKSAPVEDFVNGGPSATLLGLVQQVKLNVSFEDIAALSSKLLGPIVPENSIVTRAWYRVLTTFTSATDAATIGIGFATDDSNGIVAATAISAGGNVWDAGNHEAIQTGSVANFGEILTADRQIQFTRGGAEVLTAGELVLVCEFVTVA